MKNIREHKAYPFIIILIVSFIIAWLAVDIHLTLKHSREYPKVEDLKRSGGMIHHPTYGDYPEEIPFKEGMTLMPGQRAEVIIELNDEEVLKTPKEVINGKVDDIRRNSRIFTDK